MGEKSSVGSTVRSDEIVVRGCVIWIKKHEEKTIFAKKDMSLKPFSKLTDFSLELPNSISEL
jgi:hypothetical protein